jgi:hypothetical protein
MLPVTFLLVALTFSLQSATEKHSKDIDISSAAALELLDEAYRAAEQTNTDDRAIVLLSITQATRNIDPRRHRQWSNELFRFARYEMNGDVRRAMQKNAIVELAAVDPDAASRLYKQQELPSSDREQFEDARPYAAGPLFEALWSRHGKRAVPVIRQLAAWTGETGQYPYEAVGTLLVDVSNHDARGANELLADATEAYSGDAGYADRNAAFVSLLRQAHGHVRHDTENRAVSLAIDHIQRSEEKRKVLLQAHTKDRTLLSIQRKLHSWRPCYRWLARQIQVWRIQLRNQVRIWPRFLPLQTSAPFDLTAVLQQSGDAGALTTASDEAKLRLASQLMTQDGTRALSVAREIQTPELRSLAIATVVPYASLSKQDEQEYLSQLEKQVKSMEPSIAKVRLEIALAQILLRRKKIEEATTAISKAFDLAAELFAEDQLTHPGKTFEFLTGADELVKIATIWGQNAPNLADELARIRQVPDDLLRAELLTFFAKGLIQRSADLRSRPMKIY